MEVLTIPIGGHFAIYVYKIIILFTLNLHIICQLYLSKAEKMLLAYLVLKKRCCLELR